jgi:hypothetical protein
MLDLGEEGAVLFLFQCLECGGIGDDGGNSGRAGFIVHQKALGNGPTRVKGYDHKSELGEPLIGEVFINGWEEADDNIPEKRLPEFFTWKSWSPLCDEYPDVEWFDGRESTKFGGTPDGPETDPGNWQFLLLNSFFK